MTEETNNQNPSFLKRIFRVKNADDIIQSAKKNALKKTLNAGDLIILGIGAVVGTGIFTLSGITIASEPNAAGASFMISLVLAAIACIFAALSYAEFASMIPVAGSAYTYTFATFGEIIAWIIGWVLMLEYAIGNIAVAISLTSYLFEFLQGFKNILPDFLINQAYWIHNFKVGGINILLNIPAILIFCLITLLLLKGTKESVKSAGLMVFVKLAVIAIFILCGIFYVRPENWTPFMPSGLEGVFEGAFLIFFAYIGFDAVSTAAEETKHPQRNMPIGIIGSLLLCTLIYLSITAVLTGIFPFEQIVGNKAFIDAPLAYTLRMINNGWAAGLVSIGAIAGLFSVLLVLQLGSTRILFAMARDRLLPSVFSKVHPKFQTPHVITITVGLLVILGTLFLDLKEAANLCNIGTVTVFIIVSIGVIILRYKEPHRRRRFKVPCMPYLPIIGILISLCIIYKGIEPQTFISFAVWIALGLLIYFAYGYKQSSPEKIKARAEKEAQIEALKSNPDIDELEPEEI